MDALSMKRRRLLVLATAIGLVAWCGLGFYRRQNGGFTGGIYDPEYRVPGVLPGSWADRSGFQAGDRVISVEGRRVEELGMESRWPLAFAPRVGQKHRFVVERKGERVTLDVVYEPPFRAAVNARVGAMLVGFGFLSFGLWAFFTAVTSPALTMAHIGLVAGAAMLLGRGPNLGAWNGVKDHLSTAATVLLYILLLRFFVTFPRPKPVGESRLAVWATYGAWGCLLALLVAELVVHPVLYYTTGSVAGPLMLVYGLLIIAAIGHTVVKSTRAELRDSGMNVILGGFLVAIAGIVSSFVPGLNLPGWTSALSILAIPLTMALAVRRQARRDATLVSTGGAG
ncbi:MAG: hypothetical protein HZB13_05405 [Acidobacteria bacterium]|nr:hypothetical protein [Acidobacteriota bacterium]